MAAKGVRWEVSAGKLFDPSAINGVYDVPPGGAIRAVHEGVGLVTDLFAAVEREGIDVWYEAPAYSLVVCGSRVEGVTIRRADEYVEVRGAVVLASGGFESNPEMRSRYLGEGWDLVKVRGTRFNMGTMITEALRVGAAPAGHWAGCHATPIDATAPPYGDISLTDKTARYSYPYALLVNQDGERFVDEGEDQVWLTYAKTGSAIRRQPGNVAYQLFDANTVTLVEPRYSTGTPLVAGSIEKLAAEIGVPPTTLARTVEAFNDAVPASAVDRFDPTQLDGVRAEPKGQPAKSNWAQRLEVGPFTAYPCACGITFTYGGLQVGPDALVRDTEGRPMAGLYATGEITGGFFYFNYGAGTGLMRGAVFGRMAGANAARHALAGASVST
jgi:tricarballylate dehydrogenase